ncbi:subtilase [Colletotrichum higginsianum]|nr:subtilase [Colletotrichum higginsianum]
MSPSGERLKDESKVAPGLGGHSHDAILVRVLAAPVLDRRDEPAPVPGKYIVILKKDAGANVESHLNSDGDRGERHEGHH